MTDEEKNAVVEAKAAGKKAADEAAAAKPKKVRVIVEKGTLGPDLLVFGDETENPEYVALLEIKGQKKVVAVK